MRRAALAVAAVLALPATATAAPGAETGLEDERLLLDSPREVATATVAAWQAIGIDVVRLHARWADVAPAGRSRPSGFAPADHRDPRYHWEELDRAIPIVRAAGMKLALTVTGPGPLWSSRSPGRGSALYKPNPAAFADFTRAVANRYGPSVDRYLVWNEPNQPGWLQPQNECVTRRRRTTCRMTSPHLYRGLYRAAYNVIRAVDPTAEIVIGELAPIGKPARSARTPVPPLPFLRAMTCLDERYKRLRVPECATYSSLSADALGHHPHGVKNGPEDVNPDRTEAQVADLPRLFGVLDRLTRLGRLRSPSYRQMPVHLTEFGYQTSPPDHQVGIRLDQQDAWLQQTAYLAWKHPRILSLIHYQWEDEPVRYRGVGNLSYTGWQSGLHFVTGRPKPALRSFPTPLVFEKTGPGVGRLWGQVRPGGVHAVRLERRRFGETAFTPVADLQTAADGTFSRTTGVQDGDELRFAYALPSGDVRFSGVLTFVSAADGKLTAAVV